MVDDVAALLQGPPRVPTDIARFTSDALFGEPGLYPEGPPMRPATGHRHSDAAVEDVMVQLVGSRPRARPARRRWSGSHRSCRLFGPVAAYVEPCPVGAVIGNVVLGVTVVPEGESWVTAA